MQGREGKRGFELDEGAQKQIKSFKPISAPRIVSLKDNLD
jgi:hypothetical protein